MFKISCFAKSVGSDQKLDSNILTCFFFKSEPVAVSPPIISGTGKATNFKFGQNIQRVHQNKTPLRILEKRELGCIQGMPNFGGTPYYPRNG